MYRENWARALLFPFLSVPHEKTFIFIVGCYNSGTTLLNAFLSAHEEISGLNNEGAALTGELKTPEELGWNRMWYKCRDQLEICRMAKKPNAARLKKDWAFWFDPGKNIWLEKSIMNSLNIDWLEEKFEHPYFIWIVRNGYAASEGIRRRTMQSGKHPDIYEQGYPIEMCAKQWVVSNEVIEQKLSSTKNFIKTTYEYLTDDTDMTLKNIIDWLPLKSKKINTLKEFTFHRETANIVNMNNKSISRLSAMDIESVNTVASDMLIKHDYKVIEGAHDLLNG